jgi:iron-sulfur cluster repair protein YtfE (RIC family)
VMNLINHFQQLPGDREYLVNQLKMEMSSHSRGEEYAFYPQLQDGSRTRMLISKAVIQHREIQDIISLMQDMESGYGFMSFLLRLEDKVQQHIETEESQIFPIAQNLLSEQELDCIAALFIAEKEKAARGCPVVE